MFGTAEAVTGIADSDYEAEAAAYMRHAWATFAKDPVGGLSEELNWPKYNPDPLSPTEIQLSLGQATRAILAPSAVSDAFCPIVNGVESLLFKLIPILEKVVNLFANNPNSKEASQVTNLLKQPWNTKSSLENYVQNLESLLG